MEEFFSKRESRTIYTKIGHKFCENHEIDDICITH